jgi:hypothetical protein
MSGVETQLLLDNEYTGERRRYGYYYRLMHVLVSYVAAFQTEVGYLVPCLVRILRTKGQKNHEMKL